MTEDEIQAQLTHWVEEDLLLDLIADLCKTFGKNPSLPNHEQSGQSSAPKRINWLPKPL